VVVWIRAHESAPVTSGRRWGARTAKLFITWNTALIERPCRGFLMRPSLHFHFLLTTLFDLVDYRCWMNI
jgi:hypothetical protein